MNHVTDFLTLCRMSYCRRSFPKELKVMVILFINAMRQVVTKKTTTKLTHGDGERKSEKASSQQRKRQKVCLKNSQTSKEVYPVNKKGQTTNSCLNFVL